MHDVLRASHRPLARARSPIVSQHPLVLGACSTLHRRESAAYLCDLARPLLGVCRLLLHAHPRNNGLTRQPICRPRSRDTRSMWVWDLTHVTGPGLAAIL